MKALDRAARADGVARFQRVQRCHSLAWTCNWPESARKLTLYLCKSANLLRSLVDPADAFEQAIREGAFDCASLEIFAARLPAIGGTCLGAARTLEMMYKTCVRATLSEFGKRRMIRDGFVSPCGRRAAQAATLAPRLSNRV